MKYSVSLSIILLLISCNNSNVHLNVENNNTDTIVNSNKIKNNKLVLDLDGDKSIDTITLVINKRNNQSGLKISFGSKKIVYFGMGKNVLNQGFTNFDWIGVFEKVQKGQTYWNNVGQNGDILIESEIKAEDKITLKNDAIFIHAIESCGGGIIYFDAEEFKWIQQE
jgi:hypothetical protein